jgi:hypothetical protein
MYKLQHIFLHGRTVPFITVNGKSKGDEHMRFSCFYLLQIFLWISHCEWDLTFLSVLPGNCQDGTLKYVTAILLKYFTFIAKNNAM